MAEASPDALGEQISLHATQERTVARGQFQGGNVEGLALAVERLRGIEGASKVAILLTDGVSNAGDIDPLHAADLAAQHGIKVYAIGAGTTGLAPVPMLMPGGRVVLEDVVPQGGLAHRAVHPLVGHGLLHGGHHDQRMRARDLGLG